jgi:ribosome recycling factor
MALCRATALLRGQRFNSLISMCVRSRSTARPYSCVLQQHVFGSVNTPTGTVACLTGQQYCGYAKRAKDSGKKDQGPKKGHGRGPEKPGVELSSEELSEVIDFDKMTHQMEAALEHLRKEYAEQLTLRTSTSVFDGLIVATPDGEFPLIQIAQVVQKSPHLVLINLAASPQYITHVKVAISNSGMNVNPQQDGTSLFVPVPRVTREHREMLAKNAKLLCDKAKDKLRNIQNNFDREVKRAKDKHSEDLIFNVHETILATSKGFMEKADSVLLAKQNELLNE